MVIAMERLHCPACLSHGATPTGTKKHYEWLRCRRCKTRYVARPEPEHAKVYDDYYGNWNLDIPSVVREQLRRVVQAHEKYRLRGRWLDVGFGAGHLLEAASSEGWDCWGTEISRSAIEARADAGWHMLEGDLLEVELKPASFDVVSLVEVLEHLPDPRSYLTKVAELLRPRGAVYATTPNGRSLNARVLGVAWSVFEAPEHLQLFSPQGLRRASHDCGLHPLRVLAHGLNPVELRKRGRTTGKDRVQVAHSMNEALASRSGGRLVKRSLNAVLSASRLGDSLKLTAEKI